MSYLKKDLLPLETDRLLLRLLEPEESALMVHYITENREHLAKWEPLRVDKYYEEEIWRRELIGRQNQFFTGQGVRLVMFEIDVPGRIIGVINFTDFMRGVFQACFLGYSIDYRKQGQGLMYEALSVAIDFVFSRFKLHRIMANYVPRNDRSGKLLKRLGFTVEGYARDYLKIAGCWEDHILTSKINENI